MRIFLEGRPDLYELHLLRQRVRDEITGGQSPYEGAGLSARLRFLYELPATAVHVRPELPTTPATSTLAWYWLNALEGLAFKDAGQVVQVTARKEWARVAGVEVIL